MITREMHMKAIYIATMVEWLQSTEKPSNSDSRVRTRTATDQNECLIPMRTSLCVFEVDGVKL
jgi:hypothetical protein